MKNFEINNVGIIVSKTVLFCIAYFIIIGIFQLIGIEVSKIEITTFNPETLEEFKEVQYSGYQYFVNAFFSLLGAVLIVFTFMKFEGRKLIDAGFKFNLTAIILAFIIGGIFIPLFFVIFLFAGQLSYQFLDFQPMEFLWLTLFLLVAALVEELIFRAYLMTMVEHYASPFWAILISATCFSLAHAFNPNLNYVSFISLFVAGTLLGFAYYKTRNIWFVTAMHFSWNYMQTLIGFNISGKDVYSLIQFTSLKQNLITGGNFGFEGSVFSILAMVLMFAILTKINLKIDNS